ncbi:MAG: HAMP domain-containing histidine kinase [Oscillospiraceae bacterium]|nr:HAMP domain-containing histidine kinase [Oscillospiraceae bacterium]
MRKGISSLISVCFVMMISSLVILSACLVTFSSRFFRRQAERELSAAAENAASITKRYCNADHSREILHSHFTTGAEWTDAELILFDDTGKAVVTSEKGVFEQRSLSQYTIGLIGNRLVSFNTLDGFFDKACLSVIIRVDTDSRIYYVLSYLPPYGFDTFIRNMLMVCFAALILISIITYPLLRFRINRYSVPIKKMTLAAKKYGEGDFSEKVEVEDHDEMGLLARTLNEMATSLDEIEESRKSFVSNVSHELKTPMTTIGGFVDGILDGTIPENERRRYLRIVSEETGRLARLVRSMLNISKYESGEIELSKKSFNLTELTIKTVLLFEHRIEDKHIEVRGLDADVFYVNADPDLIQQVNYNLTENAVKFVDEGGYIEYVFYSNEGKTSLAVRNSGSGLKKNEMNKVFDRFYKTDESRGKDTTGVGLGLSIVRSIIRLHSGDIQVSSVEGEYTEFEFTI